MVTARGTQGGPTSKFQNHAFVIIVLLLEETFRKLPVDMLDVYASRHLATRFKKLTIMKCCSYSNCNKTTSVLSSNNHTLNPARFYRLHLSATNIILFRYKESQLQDVFRVFSIKAYKYGIAKSGPTPRRIYRNPQRWKESEPRISLGNFVMTKILSAPRSRYLHFQLFVYRFVRHYTPPPSISIEATTTDTYVPYDCQTDALQAMDGVIFTVFWGHDRAQHKSQKNAGRGRFNNI